ncbi:calcium-binding protein [Mesorhizobium sp. ASY16-5R]|uniref:calcium-binding protein n=1 Tax=Mesorhizobium sp. ASY16-5R TaxID=3445772 RepID=UPI003FA0E096
MPTKIIYQDRVGTGIQETLLADEDVYVAGGVTVGSTENEAIAGTTSDHEFTVDGYVFGDYMGILNNNDLARNNHVVVGETGTVSASFHSGVYLSGGEHTVANYGEIRGSTGITMYTTSIDGGQSTIVNHGLIHGDHTGIGRQNSDVRETLVVTNYGTIYGGTYSYSYSAGDSIERIINKGLMIGDVSLGDNNDLYDGRLGTLDGRVEAGSGNDSVYGGTQDDLLYGQDGTDTLMGGAGADLLNGGSGADRASYASATKAVIVSLANPTINSGDAFGDSFVSIENLSGSNYDDFVFGNSATNALNGGAGNDSIKGYGGKDTLTGYTGADIFVFNSALSASTNVDTITDFSVADDTIQIDNAFFTGLPTGVLAASAFRANSTGLAGDASDRVIFEFDTGRLFFDADGNGAGARIQFATLTVGLGLTAADFVVI